MVGSARRPATFYLLVGRAVGRPGWCIAAGAVRSTRSTVTLQWIPTARWYGRGVERARHAARGRRGRAPAPACLALVSKLAVRVAWVTTPRTRNVANHPYNSAACSSPSPSDQDRDRGRRRPCSLQAAAAARANVPGCSRPLDLDRTSESHTAGARCLDVRVPTYIPLYRPVYYCRTCNEVPS